jgi:hypothetical protein
MKKLNFKRILGVLSAVALVTATATSITAVSPNEPKDSKWEYWEEKAVPFLEKYYSSENPNNYSSEYILQRTHRLRGWYEFEVMWENEGEVIVGSDGNIDLDSDVNVIIQKVQNTLKVIGKTEETVGISKYVNFDTDGFSYDERNRLIIDGNNYGQFVAIYPYSENSVVTEEQVNEFYSALKKNADGFTVRNLEYMLSSDIDDSDTLNVNDVVYYLRALQGYTVSEQTFACADSNQDKKIDVVDLVECVYRVLE